MVLKRKENCKLIYVNNKYYIETSQNLYHFNDDFVEAMEYYNNIREIEKRGQLRFVKGKFRIELYPSELTDVLHAIECYKFSVDKSFYFQCDFEKLKEKSFDLEFLYNYLFYLYRDYIKEVEESSKVEGREEINTIKS